MIDLTALRAEIAADPLGLGYLSDAQSVADNAVAEKLNRPRVGNSSMGGLPIFRGVIDGREVVAAISSSEFLALPIAQQNLVIALTGASGGVDTSAPLVRAAFASIFSAATASRAALVALSSRPGSRAEQLFGLGTTVSDDDVARAR